MKTKPAIKLGKDEEIVACVPESCSGPGWSNTLIWVWIKDNGSGSTRVEALQPESITPEMYLLFAVCEAAHSAMLNEVKKVVR